MVHLVKLSKWMAITLAALVAGYFAVDRILLSPQKQAAFDVTLSWTAPIENDDNSPLTDLAGYVIHYGTQAGEYSNQIVVNDPKATSYIIDDLSPGTYYFAITAINADGANSAPSNVIVKTFP